MHQALSILTIVLAVALPAFDLAVVRPRRSAEARRGERVVYAMFLIALAMMALSSIVLLAFAQPMRGWMLIVHMSIAPLFAVGIAALAVLWAGRPTVVVWIVLAAGFVTILSAMFTMMTWFGSDWQRLLLDTHRVSSMVLVVAAAVQAGRVWLAERAEENAASAGD